MAIRDHLRAPMTTLNCRKLTTQSDSLLRLSLIILLGSLPLHAAVYPDPGSRGVDWDAVQNKVERFKWAHGITQSLKTELRQTQKRYAHPPLGETGWFHEYYCDRDARRLTFDPDKPGEHVCAACGTVYRGSPYDDVWRSTVHSHVASSAEQAAVLFRITGDRTFLQHAKGVLIWYADNLKHFQPHGTHAGKGWIREQSLDEATHLVRLATAYWGVDMQRTIRLTPQGIRDRVRGNSEQEHTYDLFYHIRGTLKQCSANLKPARAMSTANGYDYIKDLKSSEQITDLITEWDLRDTKGTLTLNSRSSTPYELLVGTCPDNPADRRLSVIILRQKAKQTQWDNQLVLSSK